MACLNYTLREYCDNNGNSSIDKYHLYKLLDESLRFSNEEILYEQAISKMLVEENIFVTSENRLALSMLYYAEKRILEFFQRRKDEKNRKIIASFDEYIDKKRKL